MLITFFFFFNDTATTEIYTLSLHDALPICPAGARECVPMRRCSRCWTRWQGLAWPCGLPASRSTRDRKSTRLNSSHGYISYAVFCLKKKKHKHNLMYKYHSLIHSLYEHTSC